MGLFLDAAYKVLTSERKPLPADVIVKLAVERGMLVTSGKTPAQTMKSKLSTDILKNKKKSIFKRASAGEFALREWTYVKEYISPRFTKALFDEDIIVFDKDCLDKFINGEGITKYESSFEDFISELNLCSYSTRRKDAEQDESLIQLVSVFIVRFNGMYLTHKRAKRLPEKRLHDYYSVMLGGHLTPEDYLPMALELDTMRELREELILSYDPKVQFLGVIYDSSTEVSKLHLGLIFKAELSSEVYEIGERGFLIDSKLETLEEMYKRIDEFENWSQLLIRSLSDHEL
jgi:predicted NUDIX family phosphoesterase